MAFGKQGSAEAYASGTGLSLLAAWKFPKRWGTNTPSGAEVARLAVGGDADALQILALNAEAVGEVAALLTDTLGLDLVLLGSLAGYLGENWLAAVQESFRARVLPFLGEKCVIAPAGLGRRLQDCSALAAARAGVA